MTEQTRTTIFAFLLILVVQACNKTEPVSNEIVKDAAVTQKAIDTSIETRLPKSIGEILTIELTRRLGTDVSPVVKDERQYDQWVFVCGYPASSTGQRIDYSKTNLKRAFSEGLIDDYFCALFSVENHQNHLRELILGDTDSPVLDWIDKYQLPSELVFNE